MGILRQVLFTEETSHKHHSPDFLTQALRGALNVWQRCTCSSGDGVAHGESDIAVTPRGYREPVGNRNSTPLIQQNVERPRKRVPNSSPGEGERTRISESNENQREGGNGWSLLRSHISAARSIAPNHVRDVEAGGSNPPFPTDCDVSRHRGHLCQGIVDA
jgi:hypothetical protein